MGDPRLVEEVLGEEWIHVPDGYVESQATGDTVGSFHGEDDDNALMNERARQAALGHRALRLLANPAVTFTDKSIADEAYAIIRELRGES